MQHGIAVGVPAGNNGGGTRSGLLPQWARAARGCGCGSGSNLQQQKERSRDW
jgi:hypothetical protein